VIMSEIIMCNCYMLVIFIVKILNIENAYKALPCSCLSKERINELIFQRSITAIEMIK